MHLTVYVNKIRRKHNSKFIDYDGYPMYDNKIVKMIDNNGVVWDHKEGIVYEISSLGVTGEIWDDQTVNVCLHIYEKHIEIYLKYYKSNRVK